MKNTTTYDRKQFMTELAEKLETVGAEFVHPYGEDPYVDIPLGFRTWLSVEFTDGEAAAYAFDSDGAPLGVTGAVFTADATGATDNGYVLFVTRPQFAKEVTLAALKVCEEQAKAENEEIEKAMAVSDDEG